MSERTNRYMINVVTRDHVGIISTVSGALYELDGNLEAVSQTVVWGWFTMIICGALPENSSVGDIESAVESAGDFKATVFPSKGEEEPRATEGEPFIVTVKGRDSSGSRATVRRKIVIRAPAT